MNDTAAAAAAAAAPPPPPPPDVYDNVADDVDFVVDITPEDDRVVRRRKTDVGAVVNCCFMCLISCDVDLTTCCDIAFVVLLLLLLFLLL